MNCKFTLKYWLFSFQEIQSTQVFVPSFYLPWHSMPRRIERRLCRLVLLRKAAIIKHEDLAQTE